MEKEAIKKFGRVYTPSNTISLVLDTANYKGKNILGKKVIDNSAGNGEFLLSIMKRYIEVYRDNGGSEHNLVKELEENIFGIEIDKDVVEEIKKRIEKFSETEGLIRVPDITIENGDALLIDRFDGKMDFVIGNPPYVRWHNLVKRNEYMKKYSTFGTSDLYILFFIKGLEMLKKTGTLSYITPNSYFTSRSGETVRKILLEEKCKKVIVNYGLENPFKNADTYPCITAVIRSEDESFEYRELHGSLLLQTERNSIINKNNFIFNVGRTFKNIENDSSVRRIKVKNGAAANAQKFFFNSGWNGKYVTDAYKASNGKTTKTFFPYDEKGELIPLGDIKKNNPFAYKELIKSKEHLINRSLQNNKWYEYARTQGIKDFATPDGIIIAFNQMTKLKNNVKVRIFSNEKIVVYAGLYIKLNKKDKKLAKAIKQILESDGFAEYVSKFNKPKNGGFYSFTSIMAEKYINYKLKDNKNVSNN